MGKQGALTAAGALDVTRDRRGDLDRQGWHARCRCLVSLAGFGRLGLGDLGVPGLAAAQQCEQRHHNDRHQTSHDDNSL